MNCKKNRQRVYDIGTALALIGYPLLAGFAFAVHPDLFSLAISHDVSLKIAEFHGNDLLHFGHFLMLLGAPLLIAIAAHFQKQITRPRGWWWLGYIGMLLASAGAIILAVDKTALCLVPSAFDTLTEAQFAALTPGIEALFQYKGWLWIMWLLPLLPLGFILQTVALVGTKAIPRVYSVPMLIGSILMMNPDIDIIGLAATIMLAVGFFPYAVMLLRGRQQRAVNPDSALNPAAAR
jgi:hypothetical protein